MNLNYNGATVEVFLSTVSVVFDTTAGAADSPSLSNRIESESSESNSNRISKLRRSLTAEFFVDNTWATDKHKIHRPRVCWWSSAAAVKLPLCIKYLSSLNFHVICNSNSMEHLAVYLRR